MEKSLLLLVISSYLFWPIFEINGAVLPIKPVSIFDTIKNDKEVCETKNIFSSSRYAESCKNVNFLSNNETLDENNTKEFLCLGLYDRISRICFLSSMSTVGNKALPENTTGFDLTVQKLLTKNSTDAVTFCQNWKTIYPPQYPKIKPYVSQLEEALKKWPMCIRICSNFQNKFEPLCAVLTTMDEMSMNFRNGKETGKSGQKNNGQKQPEGGKGNVENIKSKEEIVDKTDNPTKNKKNKDDEPEATNKGEKNNPSEIDDKTETKVSGSTDHSTVVEKSKNNEEKTADSEKKNVDSVIQKPVTSQAVPSQTGKDTGVESVKETEKDVEDPEKSLEERTENDLKTDVQKNNEMDVPQTGDEDARAMNDNSDEDTEMSNYGKEQEDNKKQDVISEHTQNEDAAPDLPVMSVLNEDFNEDSVETAKKRGFGSRIPGLREDDDSHFFSYFTVISVICIAGYVGYHNKQKILAMVLEGRRSRGGRGRRRPSTANYRKLDCTLEEAVTSQANCNVTHVIY